LKEIIARSTLIVESFKQIALHAESVTNNMRRFILAGGELDDALWDSVCHIVLFLVDCFDLSKELS